MDLHVDLQARRDVAGQLYRGLRARILDGRLRDGEQVPPSRELAQRLGVARNTVSGAYAWLTAEGLLVSRGRAGSFVQNAPRERGARAKSAPGVKLRPRAVWRELRVSPPSEPPAPYDFRVGTPDVTLFPSETWRRLMARQLHATAMTSAYADPRGHPDLRESVARHVGVSRGVRAEARDVLITHGAQQALDLAGRVLYVGSFSKVLLPSLRLGFLIAPPSLQRELPLAKQVTDGHSQLPAQVALARFIDSGAMARHLRKTRREYEQRHTQLSEGLTRHFGDALEQLPSVAGLHLCVMFKRGGARLEQVLTRRARAEGFGIEELSRYYAGPPTRHGWVLGYGGITTERIDEGLRHLRARLEGAL